MAPRSKRNAQFKRTVRTPKPTGRSQDRLRSLRDEGPLVVFRDDVNWFLSIPVALVLTLAGMFVEPVVGPGWAAAAVIAVITALLIALV